MKRMGALAAACAAMLAVGCGGDRHADEPNRPDAPAVGTAGDDRDLNMGTRGWVEDRMEGGMTEVKLGELATQKARNAEVKAFGRMMIEDHTKAGDELKQVVAKHNVAPPAELGDDHRDKVERLSKLDGAEFDREYINAMVEAHEKTLNALEERLDKEGTDENPRYTPKQADNAVERELNQWAAKTVPTVRQHLEKARQLDQKLDRRATNNDR